MPTLIVEDGSIVSGANVYISYTDANTYFSDRGIDAWSAATQADREEALIRGASYLENRYRTRWKGSKTEREQAMAWPRMANVSRWGGGYVATSGVILRQDGHYIASDEIPTELKHANAEAALLVVQGVDLQPRLAYGGAISSKTVKAGPVMTSTTYKDGSSARDRITAIEDGLSDLITSGMQMPMVRG